MSDLRTAAQQALEYMKSIGQGDMYPEDWAIVGRLEAALAQQAEPVESVAWLRVIDEAMVTHHLGVADLADDYETAKRKMNNLLCMAQDIGAYFAAPSQRKPLPRHDQHSVDVPGYGLVSVKLARAIEAAHGIIESEIQGDKA